MVLIGLDIGGTKLLAAAADLSGTIQQTLRYTTPRKFQDGLFLLQQMIRELSGTAPVAAIGAAIGGPLEHRSGVVSPLHQPDWRDIPLKKIMEDTFGCPFWVDVDTNVAALGEYACCEPTPARLVYLTVSTGMGGALLLDGRLYRGWNAAHPEVGHMSVPLRSRAPEKVICECGAPDCLEGLVSGNGIRRIFGKPAEQLADDEWAEVGWHLGQGLRNIVAAYAPDLVIIGGGVAVGGAEKLLKPARDVLHAHLKIVPVPPVRLSSLGQESALRGAVYVARQAFAGKTGAIE